MLQSRVRWIDNYQWNIFIKIVNFQPFDDIEENFDTEKMRRFIKFYEALDTIWIFWVFFENQNIFCRYSHFSFQFTWTHYLGDGCASRSLAEINVFIFQNRLIYLISFLSVDSLRDTSAISQHKRDKWKIIVDEMALNLSLLRFSMMCGKLQIWKILQVNRRTQWIW